MKTDTQANLSDSFYSQKKYTATVILLCIGYFIDFYDLTIFSASYVNVFRDLFHIYDITEIQKLYLHISSIYTAGIFVGAILFGVLGDKFGRILIIRYSILIYSIAMIASVFSHSIELFTLLRFICGVGLATEFATSSVLINELFVDKKASQFTSFLYFCGVLGGMTATYIGWLSWQVMYLFGGVAGIIIYLLRKNIYESLIYLNMNKQVGKGQLLQLINNFPKLIKFIRLWLLIVPFNFLIVIMFMLPRFMPINDDLAQLVKVLLIGFFIGNLISSIACNYVVNWFKDFRQFLWFHLVLFVLLIPSYVIIAKNYYFLYAIGLGLLGGGPVAVWIQVVVRSYGANIRSTASNSLFAAGRASAIVFNLLIVNWLYSPKIFQAQVIGLTIIVAGLFLLALLFTANNYNTNMEYLEQQ
jgi:MFS family permease